MIRVALCEDHREMRLALRLLLKLSKDIELVCEASNGQEAVDCAKRLQPDVLVMDIHMPELDGFAATQQITDLSLPTRVILISGDIGTYVARRAAAVGAQGFLPKDDVGKLLLSAIEAVHAGETVFVE
jgi:DNA-binding NarL/FixJ family response regulator